MFRKELYPIIKNKKEVLDAGVGPLASYSIGLSRMGFNLTGVDISKTTLKNAKEIVKKK